MAKTNINLVGPMGAGKSTIGRRLAKALGRTFKDSDKAITERTGVDIPLIFELEGEAGFRKREAAIIEELTQQQDIVLATGGGAVLDPKNRENLRNSGVTIYLNTTVEQQLQRTARDKNRPLLQTQNPRARLEALFAERDPLYREVADIIMSTDTKPVGAVVEQISRQLKDWGFGADPS